MKTYHLIILSLALLFGCQQESINKIDLSGIWRFQIDSLDVGMTEKWFGTTLQDAVELPGSMTTNGKGNAVTVNTKWTGGIVDSSWYYDEKYAKYRQPGNIKIPFWLQPEKYYVGASWYQTTVIIPKDWRDRYVELFLERCHWETRVWVDEQFVGTQNSLATPHVYNLSEWATPGEHVITILIDNRIKEIDPGINSHSIADHTQTNWNGMVGEIALKSKPKIWLSDMHIYPDVENGRVGVTANILNYSNSINSGKLTISTQLLSAGADPAKIQLEEPLEIAGNATNVDFDFSLGEELGTWDEFYPNLYRMDLQLKTDEGTHEEQLIFGMRELQVDSTWFMINGKPIFLRGTLECAIFPRTGYPPTDKTEWKRIISVAKSHGLNHIRFHSWCPPEAAFEAADELGFYLQVECSSWANQSTTLGDGLPIDRFIYEESERIVREYGNHPSFCFMAYGNEPGGRNYASFLEDFVGYWKGKDQRRIYTGASGWPALSENQYHDLPQPRIQAWGAGLNSIINSQPPRTNFDWWDNIEQFQVPVVSHEIGQWCVYPNFREIEKYDGILKPKNFEIFRETLKENGMAHLADSFLLTSGKLQALCYKAEIEAALRTPGFAGFQLLDLHDFPGQGTALVGVLDPFWEQKGYISPEEFRQFCNTTVPLVRLEKHVFLNTEQFRAAVEVAHFGDEVLAYATPSWKIENSAGDILMEGKFDTLHIPIGNCIPLGHLDFSLASITSPQQLTLKVTIGDFENSWDFWVYPARNESVKDILITSSLDGKAKQVLQQGGAVLWSIPENTRGDHLDDAIGFSSIFWNTAWTRGQKPHSLGILCNPEHPIFEQFPTDYHSNWQWWDAMTYSNGLILDGLDQEFPIVRVIDDWFTNRPQALIIEFKVGNGKLLISGIDFYENMNERVAGRQFLHSILAYMSSDHFNPKVEMSVDEIAAYF